MSEHHATIRWSRPSPDFLKGRYSREHEWHFDGGAAIAASPSPHVVPEPWSNPAGVDPEEAFVAAVASCHMLTFLHLASKRGFAVESYEDDAIGTMTKNDNGVPWISLVTLRPIIGYGGERAPSPAEAEALHHEAHEQCFISNSIRTEVRVEAASA